MRRRLGRASMGAARLHPAADMGAIERNIGRGTGMGTSLPTRLAFSTGTSYYADYTNGNDTTGNGSFATPWKTITKGMSTIPNNATLYLRGGNYPERVDPLATWSGTSTQPKTLRAYPGETPVLQRYIRTDPTEVFNYWRFQGLTFYGTLTQVGEDTSFYGRSGNHIEFLNCIIKNQPLGSGMVVEAATSDWQWWNCAIFQNGRTSTILDHGLYVSGDSHVIANCVVYKNSSYGIQLWPACTNTIVTNCTIIENGIRSSDANYTGGIVLEASSLNSTQNNTIVNCVIGWNTGAGVRTGGSDVGNNNKMRYCDTFGNTLGGTAELVRALVKTGNITSDPSLTDRTGEDYSLQSGSPCLNAAELVYAPNTDYAGKNR